MPDETPAEESHDFSRAEDVNQYRAVCICGWERTGDDYVAAKTEGVNHAWVARELGEAGHAVSYETIEETDQ